MFAGRGFSSSEWFSLVTKVPRCQTCWRLGLAHQRPDLLEAGVCDVARADRCQIFWRLGFVMYLITKYPEEARLAGGWGLLMYDTKHIFGG